VNRNLLKSWKLAQWILVFIASQATAQRYTPIDSVGAIRFTIKNFGVAVEGTLRGLQGEIFINEADPDKSYFHVQVNARTIDTGINLRNKHLKKEDYLSAETFPTIDFRSTKIVFAKNESHQVVGLLTLKGITKQISIAFTSTGKQPKVFSGGFTINRQQFKVGGNSLSMADEVRIELSVPVRKANE